MSKKRYELVEGWLDVPERQWEIIKDGCTIDQGTRVLESFDTEEEALEELKKYQTSVVEIRKRGYVHYDVTEYYIDVFVIDEEGKEAFYDVLASTDMPEDLWEEEDPDDEYDEDDEE